MSFNPIKSEHPHPTDFPKSKQPPAPSPLSQTIEKIVNICLATLFTIAGVGAFTVGVTIVPFAPMAGAGAIALSVALLAIAAKLMHDTKSEKINFAG